VKVAEKCTFEMVSIRTVFASPDDYPKLIACADIGISTHCSSSGLDLPMKIVDMQGVGLPVLSHTFETITELVSVGNNALLFDSAHSLFLRLAELLKGFPFVFDAAIRDGSQKSILFDMRTYSECNRPTGFEAEWLRVAAPIFRSALI